MSAAIVAFGAVSSLGEGAAAVSAGEAGAPARIAIARDEELTEAGLRRPFAARAAIAQSSDRATVLLRRALLGCTSELDRTWPRWRARRVGLVLGTSSGGMRLAEQAFAAVARGEAIRDVESPTYFGAMAQAARGLGFPVEPAMLVLGACASSAIAIGLGCRWLRRDACDIVLAGGFDEVSVFVAAGFEALRATTATPPPRPFRVGRDGLVLGEGAAVLALVRDGTSPAPPERRHAPGSAGAWSTPDGRNLECTSPAPPEGGCASPTRAHAFVTGFGVASDAVHLTAPDPTGGGLARAALAALREAGCPEVDLVSAHATATPFNDSAEARAIARILRGRVADTVVQPFKAQIGHTLGAAGALELLGSVDAIARGILPAAAGVGTLDPETPVRLLDRADRGTPHVALKLSSAFGGIDAALVVADRAGPPSRASGAAFVRAVVWVDCEPDSDDLARLVACSSDRLARADGLVKLGLAACARLTAECGSLAAAGIVVGSAFGTLETNALFAARIREQGARAAEPRRFPYTSPNAVAGECSIAFGLTGPSFSTGGGMHAALEALAAGALLVESGDAERIVVVAVDEVGPVTRALGGRETRSGAVALLLSPDGAGALARVGALQLRRGEPASAPLSPGHLALLPLVAAGGPCELECSSPPDAFARIELVSSR